MTVRPHKLPLTPHVPRLQAPLAREGRGALVTLVHDLMAELRAKEERIADLEAEVFETRARGPFIPVTLGCL